MVFRCDLKAQMMDYARLRHMVIRPYGYIMGKHAEGPG